MWKANKFDGVLSINMNKFDKDLEDKSPPITYTRALEKIPAVNKHQRPKLPEANDPAWLLHTHAHTIATGAGPAVNVQSILKCDAHECEFAADAPKRKQKQIEVATTCTSKSVYARPTVPLLPLHSTPCAGTCDNTTQSNAAPGDVRPTSHMWNPIPLGHDNSHECLFERFLTINQECYGEQMCIAAYHGDIEDVKALLTMGMKPRCMQQNGITALHIAAGEGHVEVIKCMLSAGFDPNEIVVGYSSSALMWACYKNHSNIVRILLSNGAYRDYTNSDGWSALLIAAQQGHDDIVALLLSDGADPNLLKHGDGASALILAAQGGHTHCIELLLEHKANPNTTNNIDGGTAIITAAAQGHIEVTKTLIAYGATIDHRRTDNGGTALIAATHRNNVDIVKVLLDGGADPNIGYVHDGVTPLMLAAQEGSLDIVRLLLWNNANPSQRKRDTGSTPLMWSTLYSHQKPVHVLCAFGAEQYPVCRHQGMVHTARSIASRRSIPGLVEFYAAIEGWSPLQIGIGCDLPADVRIALKLGRIDPFGSSRAELLEIANTSGMWPGKTNASIDTLALIDDVMRQWSPVRHNLYHRQYRDIVSLVMLVELRLRKSSGYDPTTVLPKLPVEVWYCILGACHRNFWPV